MLDTRGRMKFSFLVAHENQEIRLISEQRPLPVFLPCSVSHRGNSEIAVTIQGREGWRAVIIHAVPTDHYDTGDFPIIVTLIKAERRHAGRGCNIVVAF